MYSLVKRGSFVILFCRNPNRDQNGPRSSSKWRDSKASGYNCRTYILNHPSQPTYTSEVGLQSSHAEHNYGLCSSTRRALCISSLPTCTFSRSEANREPCAASQAWQHRRLSSNFQSLLEVRSVPAALDLTLFCSSTLSTQSWTTHPFPCAKPLKSTWRE